MNYLFKISTAFILFSTLPNVFASGALDMEEGAAAASVAPRIIAHEDLARQCHGIYERLRTRSSGMRGPLEKMECAKATTELVLRLDFLEPSYIKAYFDDFPREVQEEWRHHFRAQDHGLVEPFWARGNDYQLYFQYTLGRALWDLYDQAIFSGFRHERTRSEHMPGLVIFEQLIAQYYRLRDGLKLEGAEAESKAMDEA